MIPSNEHTAIWLTTTEVAQQVKVNVKVIYRAIKRGKLRAAKIDGRGDYRFKPQWVEDWVESCATPIEVKGGH